MSNKKFLIFIFGMVFCLAFVKILFANRLSTTGVKLEQYQKESLVINRENRFLAGEIARETSLLSLWPKAQALGFDKPSLVVNLTPEIPVALK